MPHKIARGPPGSGLWQLSHKMPTIFLPCSSRSLGHLIRQSAPYCRRSAAATARLAYSGSAPGSASGSRSTAV